MRRPTACKALKMIRSNSYDLVVTDLEMPQLGGMELLREMKSQAATQALPGGHCQ